MDPEQISQQQQQQQPGQQQQQPGQQQQQQQPGQPCADVADAAALRKTALVHIIDTVCLCQQRGGYSIDEAAKIHASIHIFTPDAVESGGGSARGTQTEHLQLLVKMLEKSQSQGKLSLHEAWMTYNAIQMFSTASTPTCASSE